MFQMDQDKTPLTPLIYSTQQSDLRAVEILLRHYSIRVNERDGLGNTALHYNMAKDSPTQDDLDIGKLLSAAGADSSLPNLDGKTPADLVSDFAAKAVLLAGNMEKQLPEKNLEPEFEPEIIQAPEDEFTPASKPAKKLKI